MMAPAAMLDSLEADLDRALGFGVAGDKVLMVLSGNSPPWFTGDNEAQSVTLVVPADDDFYAVSLNIYLSARNFNQSDKLGTGTDLTFRPAMWVTTDNAIEANGHYKVQDANATWKMADTFNGTYQGDTAIQIACAYSARYGQGPVHNEVPLTGWPGARKLFAPHKLKRGSTVTIGVTPTFGRVQNTATKTQFRATAVLQGHKFVRRAA